jgi:hypothetical protein
MTWFQKEIDYARDGLSQAAESAIDRAGERLSGVVREGVKDAGEELKDVIAGASREIDTKLDKISVELHNQRQFTKEDVKELVDYAAERLSAVLDDRIQVMKHEISDLVQEKTEYFKTEVDTFFIERQRDLARERRRLFINIALAFVASLAVGAVSLFYKGLENDGGLDMLTTFRIVLASLAGGYGVYLAASLMHRWLAMEEHRKDALFLAARYWGWLRPGSLASTFILLLILIAVSGLLLFPEALVQALGRPEWQHYFRFGP